MDAFMLFNLGVDSFAVIVMAILIFTCFVSFDNTQDVRLMRRTFLALLLVLLSDLFQWALDGRIGSTITTLLYIDNTLYYIFQIAAVIVWNDYVHYRVTRKVKTRNAMIATSIVPMAVVLVLMLTNPLTHFIFFIGSGNHYERGPFSNPLAFMVMGYLLYTSIWILYMRRKEKLASIRREYMILAGFVVAPFIGAVIQLSAFGISLIWPLASISMLILYINRSQDEISIDALTGLNNRGSLDKYLLERIFPESEERLTLILMDLDKFKTINDELGHDMGDVALREVSEIIRQSFSVGHNFLARYGGDEFVVVIPQIDDPRMIDSYMRALKSNVESFNKTESFPIKISISCGMAFYPREDIHIPEDLLKAADNQMYLEKEKDHAALGYRK
jgi:diguanylate cyclase (GGDEF)-like protein